MTHEIKINEKNQSHHWQFDIIHNFTKGEFIVYANGKKSFTTKDADDCPEAMKEYFDKWDTNEVEL